MVQGYGRNKKQEERSKIANKGHYTIIVTEVLATSACTTTNTGHETRDMESETGDSRLGTQDIKLGNPVYNTQSPNPASQSVQHPQQDYTPKIQSIEQQIGEVHKNNASTLEEIARQKEIINNMNASITSLEGQVAQTNSYVQTLASKENIADLKRLYDHKISELKSSRSEVQIRVPEQRDMQYSVEDIVLPLIGAVSLTGIVYLAGYCIYRLSRSFFYGEKVKNVPVKSSSDADIPFGPTTPPPPDSSVHTDVSIPPVVPPVLPPDSSVLPGPPVVPILPSSPIVPVTSQSDELSWIKGTPKDDTTSDTSELIKKLLEEGR